MFMARNIKSVRNTMIPVRHYTFKEKEGDGTFHFAYIGWDKKLISFWHNRFAVHLERVKTEYKLIRSGSISQFLKKNLCRTDIVIIEPASEAIINEYPIGFLLPRRMEMEVDTEDSLKTDAIKKIKRYTKKYSMDFEIREGIEALKLFYFGMYRPYINKRHGKSAEIAGYTYFQNKINNDEGKFFFLTRENEPVAAAFIEKKNNQYRLSAIGIKQGSEDLLKIGISGALYYFIMQYYFERGVQTLLLGSIMPVIFDGVTEFKLHIGAKPYIKDLSQRKKYYLIPVNAKALTIKILKSNPVFCLYGSELNIASFISSEDYFTKESFFQFLKLLKTRNVEKTKLFCFDNSEKMAGWINGEHMANLEFIQYEREIS
jgi:hypothetical protein